MVVMISIYALLENDVVVNLVEADAEWIADQPGIWIEIPINPETETYTPVGVGYTYDSNNNTFNSPEIDNE